MSDIPLPVEMIEAECPMAWASENLEFLGAGDTAYVYKHPTDETMVVRVSDYPDGWFLYAEQVMDACDDDEGEPSPFFPKVYWIGNKESTLIGVSERLDEIENGSEMDELVEAISAALICQDEKAWALLDEELPDFREFSQRLYARIDLKDGNIMRRGGQLVINDPLRAIPHAMEESFRERHSFSTGSILKP